MYLLDTDHMSLLERSGPEGARIRERLRSVPLDDVATTVISYEEQMRGWLSRIARATKSERQLAVYRELKKQLRNYCDIAVVDYDASAIAEYERLKKTRIRLGTMDLKIAAIALANNSILLTRNLSDFQKVPDLRAEDWSI